MPKEPRAEFSKNLNILLEQKGINRSDLASYVGVSTATASDWANGKKFPRIDKLQKIAMILNVRMSELTGDKPNLPPVLTEQETEIIRLYRKVPIDRRAMVLAVLQAAQPPQKKEEVP